MAQLVACLTGGQEVGSSSLLTPTTLREIDFNQSPFIFYTMYYTYIIYSEKIEQYYVGSAQNVEERLRRHNNNHSKSTKGKGPWKPVTSFSFETRSKAMKLEKKIKKRGSGRFLNDNGFFGQRVTLGREGRPYGSLRQN